jgi:hypothetical protein
MKNVLCAIRQEECTVSNSKVLNVICLLGTGFIVGIDASAIAEFLIPGAFFVHWWLWGIGGVAVYPVISLALYPKLRRRRMPSWSTQKLRLMVLLTSTVQLIVLFFLNLIAWLLGNIGIQWAQYGSIGALALCLIFLILSGNL